MPRFDHTTKVPYFLLRSPQRVGSSATLILHKQDFVVSCVWAFGDLFFPLTPHLVVCILSSVSQRKESLIYSAFNWYRSFVVLNWYRSFVVLHVVLNLLV
jgi:hypothetical protein